MGNRNTALAVKAKADKRKKRDELKAVRQKNFQRGGRPFQCEGEGDNIPILDESAEQTIKNVKNNSTSQHDKENQSPVLFDGDNEVKNSDNEENDDHLDASTENKKQNNGTPLSLDLESIVQLPRAEPLSSLVTIPQEYSSIFSKTTAGQLITARKRKIPHLTEDQDFNEKSNA